MAYDDMNPDKYRADLKSAGASDKEADAPVADLRSKQDGGKR